MPLQFVNSYVTCCSAQLDDRQQVSAGVSLNTYLVYCHLVRAGFTALRLVVQTAPQTIRGGCSLLSQQMPSAEAHAYD